MRIYLPYVTSKRSMMHSLMLKEAENVILAKETRTRNKGYPCPA